MSNSANKVAGLMWDDFRKMLNEFKDRGSIDSQEYWSLTDLINDYGYAMKVAGMRGEQTQQTESILSSVMGTDERHEARAPNEKYNYSG